MWPYAAVLVRRRSLTVLNNSAWTAASMLAKSWVTLDRNVPPLAPGQSRPVLLSEIVIFHGGFEAPEKSNHKQLSGVGFHSDNLSIRPTLDPCAIADPARWRDMVLFFLHSSWKIQKVTFLDGAEPFMLRFSVPSSRILPTFKGTTKSGFLLLD